MSSDVQLASVQCDTDNTESLAKLSQTQLSLLGCPAQPFKTHSIAHSLGIQGKSLFFFGGKSSKTSING